MRISVIGAGNLGSHMARALANAGETIVQVFSRDITKATTVASGLNAHSINSIDQVDRSADMVLISVSDHALPEVAHALQGQVGRTTIVAHTTGSIGASVLEGFPRYGVFYPLQTFSIDRQVNWQRTPLLITAGDERTGELLLNLAKKISDITRTVTDHERLVLHLCATFANNFGNHMFALAESVAASHNLDFGLLKPIIMETAQKVQELSPDDAQTGAAIRHDNETMQRHIELLTTQPSLAELYRMISASIQELHKRQDGSDDVRDE